MNRYLAIAGVVISSVVGGDTLAAESNQAHWVTVAPMNEARMGHAMAELPPGPNALGLTGRGAMVIGGFDSEPFFYPSVPATPLASCEVYDPKKNVWIPVAPHPSAGGWRWAIALHNGMVLVAGGATSLTDVLNDSHLYDPKANRWIATGTLPVGIANPHAFMRPILLPNGQVLIAGGVDEDSVRGALATGELVPSAKSFVFTLNERNPAASFWQYTRRADGRVSQMPEGRSTSGLVLMKSGAVLNVGGLGLPYQGGEAATNTASIFNPRSGVWSRATPMPPIDNEDNVVTLYPTALGSRWSPFSENLPDGRVLIAGGWGGVLFEAPRASAVIYDPAKNAWQISKDMQYKRPVGGLSARISSDGDILLVGAGFAPDFTVHDVAGEIFRQKSKRWELAPTDGGPPADAFDTFESQLVRLSDGRLQIAGGADFNDTYAVSGSWIFVP